MGKKKKIFILAITAMLVMGGCEKTSVANVPEDFVQMLSRSELMVFVATEKNRYEEVYTAEIWAVEIDGEGKTFGESLLEQIKTYALDLHIILAMAQEYEVVLDTAEKEQLRRLAEDYYSKLSEPDKAYTGASKEDVLSLFQQYHLANKTVKALTAEADIEISDTEAKVIEVNRMELADAETAAQAHEQLMAEGADFHALARANSGLETAGQKLVWGEWEPELEAAAFSLKTGEVSQVIAAGGKYYLIQCVNDYDEQATLERKKTLSLARRDQAFREKYDAFLLLHPREAPPESWDGISFETEADTKTTNFFALYRTYFPD